MQDRRRGRAAAVAAVLIWVGLTAADTRAEPVVPGYHRLRDEAKNVQPAELGQLLIAELNCTSCHIAGGETPRVAPKGAPDLSSVGARATPQWIRAYLSDPHKVKPGGTMPDIFHASEPAAKAGAVEFLTHFLAAQGGPLPPSKQEGTTITVDEGRRLYHTIGCVACHAADDARKEEAVPSVPHGDLAGKYTVESLAEFLLDPHKSRPAGRMPSLHLSAKEATALATYLLREQMDNPQAADAEPLRSPGLRYELYENTAFKNVELATFEQVEPTSKGTVDRLTLDLPTLAKKPADNFGVRFTGLIAVPRDGKYTFWLRSDDGGRLFIDDRLVADNDGVHAPQDKMGEIDLRAGDHTFVLTFFEQLGGEELALSWRGPDIEQQTPVPADVLFKVGGRRMIPLRTEEPFNVDPQKVAMGGRMFAAMGCVNCHAMEGLKPMRAAPPLAALDDVAAGCLAEKPPKGVPHYRLSEEQRAFIAEALSDPASLAKPLDGEAGVTRTLASMNCYACHKRGDVGGAAKERSERFTMVKPFDMGDEGRLPPKLTGVGAKLRPEAMEQIVYEGKLHVRRHHMATRMPAFQKDRMPQFVPVVQSVDTGKDERPTPEFSDAAARDGRLLVGTKGLGCVNCHGVAGVPSLGMPALDLSLAAERLKPGWFHALLLDPNKQNPGTRMPAFWYEGMVAYPEIAGGTADKQIDAVWTYLSLGKSMGLPAGLQPGDGGYELVPAGETIVHRTFMKDVGTRAILVGSQDGLHVAFDANAVRMAKAWRGRFFDAKGSREARGGVFLEPLGNDVIDLPRGPSFAVLASPNAPWPLPTPGGRNTPLLFRGYRTDKSGVPTFLYKLDALEVEETPVTLLRPGGAALIRRFSLKGGAAAGTHVLAAAGSKVEGSSGGAEWKVDGKLTIRIDPRRKPFVRDSAGVKELLVPVPPGGDLKPLEIEVIW